jgi:hypothetical protein
MDSAVQQKAPPMSEASLKTVLNPEQAKVLEHV